MAFIMHVIGLFILVAASEMLNGIARTVLLNKRVGVTKAKRIALLPALALCLLMKFGVEGYIAMIKETEAKELRKIRVNPVLRMIP